MHTVTGMPPQWGRARFFGNLLIRLSCLYRTGVIDRFRNSIPQRVWIEIPVKVGQRDAFQLTIMLLVKQRIDTEKVTFKG